MQAIKVTTFSSDASGVELADISQPTPAKGQVLVKMLYAPINPSDFNFVRGDYHAALERLAWNTQADTPMFAPDESSQHPQPPYILGGEGMGVVIASGGGFLANRLVGKRVAIAVGPPSGTWQEHTLVDAKKAVALPSQLSDEQAAMLLINPLSCLGMVTDVLAVQPNTWLLQSGAGSALGQMVIKLSKKLGFKTINIVRSEAKVAQLKQLGADVVICTETQNVREEVFKATNGKGVNYAMDCIGGDLLGQMLQCLTLNGHMLLYGTLSGPNTSLYSRDLMMPCAKISGFFAGNYLASKPLRQKIKLISKLKKLAVEGVFDNEIAKIYPIADFKDALHHASAAGKTGKVLLKIGS